MNNKRDLGALASATNLHGYKLLLLSLLCYRQKMMDDVSEEGFNTWVNNALCSVRSRKKKEVVNDSMTCWFHCLASTYISER